MLEVTDGDDLVVEDDGEDAPLLASVKRMCPNGVFRSVHPKPQLVYQMMPHYSYQPELEQPLQNYQIYQQQPQEPLQKYQVYTLHPQQLQPQQPQQQHQIVVTIPKSVRRRK